MRFTATGHWEPAASGSEVSVVQQIDVRYLLEDMFAKLAEFGDASR